MRLALALILLGCGSSRPEFGSIVLPEDTPSTTGPYRIEAYVESEPEGTELTIEVMDDDESAALPMLRQSRHDGVELWVGELPGRPVGTVFHYYLRFINRAGQKVVAPPDAPSQTFSLTISDGA